MPSAHRKISWLSIENVSLESAKKNYKGFEDFILVVLELSFKIPWTSIRWLFETYNIMIIFLCSYVGGLWGGDLSISISISPSRRLSVCVCHTDSKNTLFPFMLAESHSHFRGGFSFSRSGGLEVWRWGMNTCGGRESSMLRVETHVLRFSVSLSLSEGTLSRKGSFSGKARGMGMKMGVGMCPYRILSNINTHSQTRARSFSLFSDSLNLPFSVAARQIFVTDKFLFLCTLAERE